MDYNKNELVEIFNLIRREYSRAYKSGTPMMPIPRVNGKGSPLHEVRIHFIEGENPLETFEKNLNDTLQEALRVVDEKGSVSAHRVQRIYKSIVSDTKRHKKNGVKDLNGKNGRRISSSDVPYSIRTKAR